MLGHAEPVSRANPGSGSPMLNLTRGEYCLRWQKALHLTYSCRDVSWILAPDSSSYSLYSFFVCGIPLLCGSSMLTSISIRKKCQQIQSSGGRHTENLGGLTVWRRLDASRYKGGPPRLSCYEIWTAPGSRSAS